MIRLPSFGRVLGPAIAVSGSNRRHTSRLCRLNITQIIAHIEASFDPKPCLLRSM
jgi:hypothetical protein